MVRPPTLAAEPDTLRERGREGEREPHLHEQGVHKALRPDRLAAHKARGGRVAGREEQQQAVQREAVPAGFRV